MEEVFKLGTMLDRHCIDSCAALAHPVGTANIEPKLVDQQAIIKKLQSSIVLSQFLEF